MVDNEHPFGFLRNSEDLSKLFESFEDGVYICSADFRIEYMNKAFAKILNGDKTGETCYKAIYDLDQPCSWCRYDKLTDELDTQSYEINLPDKKIHRSVRNTIFSNGSKLSVLKDTSLIERIKDRSENTFRTIFENIPVMIDSFDSEGRCTLWNKECISQLGYTQEELNLSIDPLKLCYPDAKIRQEVQESLESPDGKFREFQVRAKNGNMKAQLWANFKLEGDIKISVGQDISKRRKREKIQQFILEVSYLPINETNLTDFFQKIHLKLSLLMSAKNFYIALYNSQNGMYTFPYHVDEFDDLDESEYYDLSNTLTDYVRKEKKAELITAERENEIFGTDSYHLVGEYSPVWLGAPLMDPAKEEPIGVIAVQDYQNAKAYEADDLLTLEIIANSIGLFIERLQNHKNLEDAKNRAIESDRLKSTFLANMSHEIRTPMNGILGFAELLQEPDVAPSEQERFLAIIQKSGNKMLTIINDLIDISKIESGQVEVNFEAFAICPLMEELFSFFVGEARKKGIELKINLDTLNNTDLQLVSDRTKVNQILINILKNSIKYTNEGSIEFGAHMQDEDIQFFIRDTGIGISQELESIIFERFTRDSLVARTNQEGSGLGLSITKGYVELLGGQIWFETKIGNGTCFYFKIPIKPLNTSPASSAG